MFRAPVNVRGRPGWAHDERKALALAVAAFALRLAARGLAGPEAAGGYDFYIGIARTFASTGALCEGPHLGCAVRLPLYPLLIRLFLTNSGVSLGLMATQAALGAAVVYGVFGFARALFGSRTGLLAALLVCVSPYAIVHDTALQDTVLVDALLAVAVWQLVRLREGMSAVRALVAGGLLGGALLTSARVGLMVAAAIAWAFVGAGAAARTRVRNGMLVALPVLVLAGGWMARNDRVVGAAVLTTEGGASLWAGNNAWTMTALPAASIDRAFAAALSARTPDERRRLDSAGSEAAEDRVYARLAWAYIAAHPAATVKAALVKMTVPLVAYLSPARGALVEAGFAIVYLPIHVLALVGAWRARSGGRAHLLPLAVLASFLLTTAIYWAHTSHAVCVDPIWFTYAAAALVGARPDRATI